MGTVGLALRAGQHCFFQIRSLSRPQPKMVDGTILGVLCACLVVTCAGYETVNTTQIKIENNSGQRDYQELEEGKVLPFRTFLTTVEIIILFILLVLLIIYLCVYGCVLPKCCRRQSKEYSQIQLNREKKISEIWKTNINTV